MLLIQVSEFLGEATDDLQNLVLDRGRVDGDTVIDLRKFAEQCLGDFSVGGNDDITRLGVRDIQRDFLAQEDVAQVLGQMLVKAVEILLEIILQLLGLFLGFAHGGLDSFVALFFGGDLHSHHLAEHARRHFQRGVFHVGRFLPEDGPQQALFRSQLGLALGCDFAHQNISRADFGTDPDHAVQVKIGQGLLPKVGDVPGNFLGAKLGVAGGHIVLADMDRRENVILDDPLTDTDRILKVVPVPRHVGDQHILSNGQFATFCARPIRY